MHILERLQAVLVSPLTVWSSVRKEEGLGNATIYVLAVAVVGAIIRWAVAMVYSPPSMPGSSMMGWSGGASPTGFITSVVFAIVWMFIAAGVLHLIARLLGAKKGFEETFKAAAYGSTPTLLLSGLPWVGLLLAIWAIALEALGMEQLQSMSRGRAVAAVILSVLVLAVVIGFIVAGVLAMIFGVVGRGMMGS